MFAWLTCTQEAGSTVPFIMQMILMSLMPSSQLAGSGCFSWWGCDNKSRRRLFISLFRNSNESLHPDSVVQCFGKCPNQTSRSMSCCWPAASLASSELITHSAGHQLPHDHRFVSHRLVPPGHGCWIVIMFLQSWAYSSRDNINMNAVPGFDTMFWHLNDVCNLLLPSCLVFCWNGQVAK